MRVGERRRCRWLRPSTVGVTHTRDRWEQLSPSLWFGTIGRRLRGFETDATVLADEDVVRPATYAWVVLRASTGVGQDCLTLVVEGI